MKHVFICGAKSIGRYGGYETFVQELARHTENFKELQLHILCKANGEGCIDEATLKDAVPLNDMEFMYHGAHCIKLHVPNLKAATAIWYDTAAVAYCLRYCRENNIEKPILYILTCRIGPMIGTLQRGLKKLGGEFQLNPDGHEWKRQKWPAPVRKYWKISERMMVRVADLVVCDSLNIEKYILETYSAYAPKTTYISYGADVLPPEAAKSSAKLEAYFSQHELTAGGYYLVVCRFVPENNIETILREFMQSKTKRKLVVITTPNQKYYNKLQAKLNFEQDARICFPGTVYDPELLKKIRKNAYAYLHGHEVGGTNPSLLEGLGATDVNLLFNVSFNEEVAQDAAMYWTKEQGSLAALLDKADCLTEQERAAMGEKAKNRISSQYSWQSIADAYRKLWSTDAEKEHA